MTISALIPARLNSTRLEKKLLKDLCGVPLIVRTYKNIVKTNLFNEVIVVTDSDEIIDVLVKNDIKFLKSKNEHKTGTDRIAEFSNEFKSDIIVNIQGDEPFINKNDLKKIIEVFNNDIDNKIDIISLMISLKSNNDIINPNNVKVIVDKNNNSIYFSRNVIPFNRSNYKIKYFKHVGIYAFRNSYLNEFKNYIQSDLEKTEMIEAIRVIENGKKIKMIEIFNEHISIDTIDDFKIAESILNNK
ncbi:MAG: 3-deoxy-manno-octulosonate cytidylyltransferase [Flavobacteriaceae bacterium]|nr:3-deoxy-manno-octulosonate cytidylyltransferase [Flavobacteriaceae bacterium]